MGYGGGKHTKYLRPEIRGVDVTAGTVDAVVSSEAVDRDGDIIRVAGWDFSDFEGHPVLMLDHNYKVGAQAGEWLSMQVRGLEVQGTARYFVGRGNKDADWAFELAKMGKAAFSVGFIPDMEKAVPLLGSDAEAADFLGQPPMEFNGQRLLEVSQVAIPSNPDALQRAITRGAIRHPAVVDVVLEVLADQAAAEAAAGTGAAVTTEELLDGVGKLLGDQSARIAQLEAQAQQAGAPILLRLPTIGDLLAQEVG